MNSIPSRPPNLLAAVVATGFAWFATMGDWWWAASQTMVLVLLIEVGEALVMVAFGGVAWLRPFLTRLDHVSKSDVLRALRREAGIVLVSAVVAFLLSGHPRWSLPLWDTFAVVVAVSIVGGVSVTALRAVVRAVHRRLSGRAAADADESQDKTSVETRLWVDMTAVILMLIGGTVLHRTADFTVGWAVVTMWLALTVLCGLLPWDRTGRVREPRGVSWFGSHR